ncbi:MAG: membrane alanyl aminopeptidase, partial [bacterium]
QMKPFVDGLKTVELDATKFNVEWVKLSNGNALKYEADKEKITIILDRVYKSSETISFTVKYSAQPKLGLTFVKPSTSDPKRPYQIWTQGETLTNREWFPCYDSPNDRATSETFITVDSKYTAISNGELIEVKENKNKKTYHWKMDYPFPSYLASLVVGEFAELKQETEGVPIFHYVYKDQLENARRSFASVPEMMRFFATKLGHPYPYKKYAEVMVYEFPGGMENITATTMTDNLVRDERAMIDNNDGLSAHELAHQWFGNLVTCRDWSELWLNEGFANFMDAVWLGHSKGQEEYLRDVLESQNTVLQRYKQGSHRPVATKRFYHPDDLFDENSYARPQVIIHYLKHILGEEAFWKAVNHYITVNRQRGLVTGTDLSKAIEDVTGQNLDWFFEQWIYKLGQPELEINSQYDEKKQQLKLTVKQLQKKDPEKPWFDVPEAYRLPVDIGITTSKGTKIHQVIINQIEQQFSFPTEEKPVIVNFDRGNYILKTVKFTRTSDELIYQLGSDEDVTGRIRAAVELKNTVYEPAILALATAAKEDKSSLVRLQAVDSLSTVKGEIVKKTLLAALTDSNWQVRQRAVTILGQFKDKDLLAIFQKITGNEPSYKTVNAAANALGLIGSLEAVEVLLELAKKPSWQDTLTRSALLGLSYSQDPRVLDVALKCAAPGNSRYIRSEAVEMLGARAKGNKQALDLIRMALTDKSSSLNYSALAALSEMSDKETLEFLEEYSKKTNLDPNLQKYAEQVVNQIKQKGAGN